MPNSNTTHEVLAAVFQVRTFPASIAAGDGDHCPQGREELAVLLWQRALNPQKGTWSLPGGTLRDDEDLTTSARRLLAEKVDLRKVAHLEQLSVFSDPQRVPGPRRIASTFLGLVPPQRRPTTATGHGLAPGFEVAGDVVRPRNRRTARAQSTCRETLVHQHRIRAGPRKSSRCRHCAKSTALPSVTRSMRHQLCNACWGRRGVLTPTGNTAPSGKSGGRPPALYRFTDSTLRVTDEFAALRPPS